MLRSNKPVYVDQNLLKKVDEMVKSGKKSPIKTYSRRSTIIPSFIGMTFEIHNGKIFNKVHITENMVGEKLGSFSLTRKFVKHGGDKKDAGKKPGAKKAPGKK